MYRHSSLMQYIDQFASFYYWFYLLIWVYWGSSGKNTFSGQVVFLLPVITAAETPNASSSLLVLHFKMKLLMFFVCYFLIWIFSSTSSCCKCISSEVVFYFPFKLSLLYPSIPHEKEMHCDELLLRVISGKSHRCLFLRVKCLEM